MPKHFSLVTIAKMISEIADINYKRDLWRFFDVALSKKYSDFNRNKFHKMCME